MSQPLIIALSAGEASGDLLGAHLIEAIKKQRPDAQFIGIGGARMIAAGCQSLFDQERLAVRGYAEVIKRLPEILKIRRELVAQLKKIRPNVFVGIDAPDFNLGVAAQLKAWKRERVNKIVQQVNQVLCLFPMEAPLYEAAGGKALFVGHPLAQTLPMQADKAAARARLKLDADTPVFAILAGSQVNEINQMAPIYFRAAQLVLRELPNAQFVSPYPTAAARARLQHFLAQPEFEKLPIRLQSARTELACTAADVVLVTSGTATLEVALCKRPMVISYKLSALTYWLVKRKIQVSHVGLPNILLDKDAVPELLQADATPEKLAAALLDWYRQPEKVTALENDFAQLHEMLRLNTDELAANAVLAECR